MLLRTIQFITLLLAAYFFGAYVHQNWIAPLPLDVSGSAFSEIIKSGIYNTVSRTQVLIGIFEVVIVSLLILQAREWKSVPYMLTFLSFIAIVVFSLINTQTILGISNEVNALATVKDPAEWSSVKAKWLNYQYMNGVVMVVVCLNLFIGIFSSLANEWKNRSAYHQYETTGYDTEVPQERTEEYAPIPEPTIG
jgi:hypothetical protein